MMDDLHGILRTLSSQHGVKSGGNDKPTSPHHLDVFREFLSHLDRVKRQPSKRPRAKPKARAAKR